MTPSNTHPMFFHRRVSYNYHYPLIQPTLPLVLQLTDVQHFPVHLLLEQLIPLRWLQSFPSLFPSGPKSFLCSLCYYLLSWNSAFSVSKSNVLETKKGTTTITNNFTKIRLSHSEKSLPHTNPRGNLNERKIMTRNSTTTTPAANKCKFPAFVSSQRLSSNKTKFSITFSKVTKNRRC